MDKWLLIFLLSSKHHGLIVFKLPFAVCQVTHPSWMRELELIMVTMTQLLSAHAKNS